MMAGGAFLYFGVMIFAGLLSWICEATNTDKTSSGSEIAMPIAVTVAFFVGLFSYEWVFEKICN